MKNLIAISITMFFCMTAIAQDDNAKAGKIPVTSADYILLKNFLSLEKNNPGIFSPKINPHWNSKLYQQQYQQLLAINKKTTFYPEFTFDSRFVSHAIPARYGSQNYIWVSTQPEYKNLGEQVTSDVISGVVNGFLNANKKKRFNINNKQGYYTTTGLKY